MVRKNSWSCTSAEDSACARLEPGLRRATVYRPRSGRGAEPRDLYKLSAVGQNRDADIDIGASLESEKARWRDAGDGEWIGVQPDSAADDTGITAEPPLPETV